MLQPNSAKISRQIERVSTNTLTLKCRLQHTAIAARIGVIAGKDDGASKCSTMGQGGYNSYVEDCKISAHRRLLAMPKMQS